MRKASAVLAKPQSSQREPRVKVGFGVKAKANPALDLLGELCGFARDTFSSEV
jgi:hypothetical protein